MISAISLEDVTPLDLPPFDGTLQPLPWDVVIIAHVDPTVALETLGPALNCAGPDGKLDLGAATATKVGEQVYSNPWVAMYDVQFDSAHVASAGYLDPPGSPTSHAKRWSFTDGRHSQVGIEMTEHCAFRAGRLVSEDCWRSSIGAPQTLATGKVVVGSSGTLMPRQDVRAAINAGDVSSIGRRTSSVHGYFDRSSVDVFTAVPGEYVLAGISHSGFDFRGTAKLDWPHGPGFLEPNNSAHVNHTRSAWLDLDTELGGSQIEFFADWSNETIQLQKRASEALSFCTLLGDQSVNIEKFVFAGGGLQLQKEIGAVALFGLNPVVRQSTSPQAHTAPVMTP